MAPAQRREKKRRRMERSEVEGTKRKWGKLKVRKWKGEEEERKERSADEEEGERELT